MVNSIKSVFLNIFNDPDKIKKFYSLEEDLPRIYELFCENGYKGDFKSFNFEVNEFLNSREIQELLSQRHYELTDRDLENVAGGVGFKRAIVGGVASLMAALSLSASAKTVSEPAASFSEPSVSVSQSYDYSGYDQNQGAESYQNYDYSGYGQNQGAASYQNYDYSGYGQNQGAASYQNYDYSGYGQNQAAAPYQRTDGNEDLSSQVNQLKEMINKLKEENSELKKELEATMDGYSKMDDEFEILKEENNRLKEENARLRSGSNVQGVAQQEVSVESNPGPSVPPPPPPPPPVKGAVAANSEAKVDDGKQTLSMEEQLAKAMKGLKKTNVNEKETNKGSTGGNMFSEILAQRDRIMKKSGQNVNKNKAGQGSGAQAVEKNENDGQSKKNDKNFLQNALSTAIKNRYQNLHMHDADNEENEDDDWD